MDRAVLGLAAEMRSTGDIGAAPMARANSRRAPELDMLVSDEWPGVAQSATLLEPEKCRTLWRHFLAESSRAVQQAVAVQVWWSQPVHAVLSWQGTGVISQC